MGNIQTGMVDQVFLRIIMFITQLPHATGDQIHKYIVFTFQIPMILYKKMDRIAFLLCGYTQNYFFFINNIYSKNNMQKLCKPCTIRIRHRP